MYQMEHNEIQRLNDYRKDEIRNYGDTSNNFLTLIKEDLVKSGFTEVSTKQYMFDVSYVDFTNKIKSLTDIFREFDKDNTFDENMDFIIDSLMLRGQDVMLTVEDVNGVSHDGVISQVIVDKNKTKISIVANFWNDTILSGVLSVGISTTVPIAIWKVSNPNCNLNPLTEDPDNVGVYLNEDGSVYSGVTQTYNGDVYVEDFISQPSSYSVNISLTMDVSEILDDTIYGPIMLDSTFTESGESFRIKIETNRLFPISDSEHLITEYKNEYEKGKRLEIEQSISVNTATTFQIEGNGWVSQNIIDEDSTVGFLGHVREVYNGRFETDSEVFPLYKKPILVSPFSYTFVSTENGFMFYVKDQTSLNYNNAFVCIQYPVSTDVSNKGQRITSKYNPLFCIYKTTYPEGNKTVKYFVIREKDILAPSEIHFDASRNTSTNNAIINTNSNVSITEENEFTIAFPTNITSSRFFYPNSEFDLFGVVDSSVMSEGSDMNTERFSGTRKYTALQPINIDGSGARILMLSEIVTA